MMLFCQIQRTEFQVVRSFLRIQNSQKRGGARITGLKQQRASVWSAGGGDAGMESEVEKWRTLSPPRCR